MTLNDLIARLSKEAQKHGNLKVGTFDGFIVGVNTSPCIDGVSYPLNGPPNELILEFETRDEV